MYLGWFSVLRVRILGAVVVLLLSSLAAPPLAAGDNAGAPASSAVAASAPTWLPVAGPVLNDPTGTSAQRRAILGRIHAAIRHTPAGATIRIATYSIDLVETADLLLEARRRGVNVQIVINDNTVGTVERRLQSRLGSRRRAASFLVVCSAACRNGSRSGNLHLKVYSFSHAGAARDVFISSSANLSGGGVRAQWNDAYTVYGDAALFGRWVRLFSQLRLDQAVTPRRVTYRTDGLQVDYQRPVADSVSRVQVSRTSGDPVIDRIRQVGCTAPAGHGSNGRTVVHVAMVHWYGDRGARIAGALAARKRAGCIVRVIGANMSRTVVRVLKEAGIPVRAADWDWGRKRSLVDESAFVYGPRCYSHLKVMTVSGTFRGVPARTVFTGSENWSPPGLSSDEITLEIRNGTVLKAYNDRWRRMWGSTDATHRTGIEPTRRPCA